MKANQLTFLFISILASLVVLSCKKDKLANPVSETSRYFPMAIGNYWIYDVQAYNQLTYTGIYLPYSDTIRIIGQKEIGSRQYFEFEADRWLLTKF